MILPDDLEYKILIVGCGGTGSQFMPFLMQLASNVKNIKEIILCDQDHFTNKNLNNQRCTIYDIDKNKAQVCCERYKLIFPNLNISYVDKYIKSKDDIYNAFEEYIRVNYCYIVIGCVDNNATRKILYNYFLNHKNIIYIDSGNDSGKEDANRNGQVIVGANIEMPTKKYYLPSVGDLYKEIPENKEDIETVGTCMRINNDYPQNIATNIMAASILMSVLTNIIMFHKIENNIIYFDVDKLSIISR